MRFFENIDLGWVEDALFFCAWCEVCIANVYESP